MEKYERSVTAALAVVTDKFDLAIALALDIPEQQGVPGVWDKLTEARQAIIDAGGDDKTVAYLGEYRKLGLWLTSHTNMRSGRVEGVSFTAHMSAKNAGISLDQLRADPKTVREIRTENGGASKDGDPDKVIAGWSDEQREAAVQKLAEVAPEVVTEVVADSPTLTAKVASKSEDKRPAKQTRSSAGTGGGAVGQMNMIVLLTELDGAVLTIDDRMPEFTALLRDGVVPRGDEMAEEWKNKLKLAIDLLDLARMEEVI